MISNAFSIVFSRPIYFIIATIISLLVFVFSVWLPNLRLIVKVLSSDAGFLQRFKFPISLLSSISTNFSLLSASYTIIMAILFGMNVAMLIFFLRRRLTTVKQTGVTVGFLGMLSGIFGIGCAACGSFLMMTFLAWFGAGALVHVLPLKGEEFGIVGIILLLISLYSIAKQIKNPVTCKI